LPIDPSFGATLPQELRKTLLKSGLATVENRERCGRRCALNKSLCNRL
jgi:hypothetical protein